MYGGYNNKHKYTSFSPVQLIRECSRVGKAFDDPSVKPVYRQTLQVSSSDSLQLRARVTVRVEGDCEDYEYIVLHAV